MSLLTFLQGIGGVGVRHLFTLNNEGTVVGDDYGNSVDPTNIDNTPGGRWSFETDPVCIGFTHCLRTVSSTAENTQGAELDNRNDINASNGAGNDTSTYDWNNGTKQVFFWGKQKEIWNVTCMFEQGGGVNNLAVMGGARVTWQAADSGQPFLIVGAKTLAIKDRGILHWGGWEHHSQTIQTDNRIWYTENGIVQGYNSDGGTAAFPNHSGDPSIGNSDDSLQTFNSDTLASQTVAQDSNLWGMVNNPPVVNLNEGDIHPESRELFERTVIAENVITGTRAQQQAALDLLTGTVFQDVNCAIEIRQATDEAGDYTLTLNNVQFVQNLNLRDIAVMWTSPNTLTLINSGGSNAVEVSTPPERELIFEDAGSIIVGGGTIVLAATRTVTINFTFAGALPANWEWRLYETSAIPGTIGTVEFAGVENETNVQVTYQYLYTSDTNASLQVIADLYQEGIDESIVLGDADQTINITLRPDTNI